VSAGRWWYWGEWLKTVDVVVVVVVVAVFDVVIVVVVAFDVVVVLLDDKFVLLLIYVFVDGSCRCDIVGCPPGLGGKSDHHDFYFFVTKVVANMCHLKTLGRIFVWWMCLARISMSSMFPAREFQVGYVTIMLIC